MTDTMTEADPATRPRRAESLHGRPATSDRRREPSPRRRPTLPRLSPRHWLVAAVVGLLLLFGAALAYLTADPSGREVGLDRLSELAGAGAVEKATFLDEDARVVVTTAGGEQFWVAYPASDSATSALLQELTASGAQVSVDAQPGKAVTRIVATGLLPLMVLAALFGLFFVGGRDGGASDIRGFGTLGKRGGGRATPPAVTFADVAGADEAVTELREVVEYLNDPGRYAALGANPPKGVLLFGPPGTGKTLIARATAGEAGVPFFSVAGAEFVESLVGVGAARIRDLFASVRAVAPAIVFIDELDAAGRRRGGAETGGSEEREQTLNQLLVELDGFAASAGIVVMGATNRPDILDPALLRPGRFDRHVTVDQPDRAGREKILQVHSRGKPLAADVDLAVVARRTPGFTGADLANVVNEATLLAIREGRSLIGMPDLVEAIERVLGGPQRRGRILGDEVRRRIAVHEAGHAVVAGAMGQEVHRVSVVSRGSGLGTVGLAGGEEAVLLTAAELADRITVAMSGRAAEEILLGSASTGSEDDLARATEIAREMVLRHGMSPTVGRVRLTGSAADVFLGGQAATGELSQDLRRRVESETARLLDAGFERAADVLLAHRAVVEGLVSVLLAEESLEGSALERHLQAVVPTT
ncbi:cell division protease FtsH [Blastococcus colisei]|uniref:ATP-dependent zinc metalloprotease FtsH n=1 Tax=Blastococcus colisei TaxID=1564162 RepID=A0A543PHZ5_9ACTN|nr:ATP-dependent zinc metalloprotease FtsH [Blastococcus colisei]TQN43703.1 cell division protease FtsH [Blastococcus colisei]